MRPGTRWPMGWDEFMTLRRLVLDVLKPHQPPMLTLAETLSDLPGVDGVDIILIEMDTKVENVKITMEGEGIDYQEVLDVVHTAGGSIHSVDKVTAGKRIIDEVRTPLTGPSWLR